MLWKKLLMEIGALSGLGGGVGGWINSSGGAIQVDEDKDSLLFNVSDSLKVKQTASKDIKRNSFLVKELNRTPLGIYRWRSEGVSEDILFVEGWDRAGQHKIVTSDKHSQAERELWGGKLVTIGNSWFGPRNNSLELENLEKAKELATQNKDKNYWTAIQESGKFVEQKDLDGLQKYWEGRNKELEEDIFGLYHGWNWWANKFGKKGDRIDLEFDLSQIRTMLDKTEEQLRDQPWSYGQIFKNPKLALVRIAGDVEGTAFNYLKKHIWPNSASVKGLKEKNIIPAILALILGGETGFDCKSGDGTLKGKYFKECEWNTRQPDWQVQKVLKSTYQNSSGFWVPKQGGGPRWDSNEKLQTRDKDQVLKMEEVLKSGLLYEKCEDEHGLLSWARWSDTANPIRREVCDQIIRPWFGDLVSDKRLCLIEVKDYSYHLRLQTYLQVLQIPSWLDKNTFWTKCSNYRI
ncbi:hypothetical protein WEN_02390 [Mycoplasma wenyonii str. Massachusetts]|uniref:Uncharacterized protein n=1 Tax=Mycoplasma wenyonii (strain Massachusetts) TaxID=1197325 RepID=I6ZJA6_MYCWM|nr:hypothetical protein [Mycoplasma wenyonii]AFN65265.1 hypothetical protein WEN_02390 [Mycoplasma wenyonii str. Massachusetts]